MVFAHEGLQLRPAPHLFHRVEERGTFREVDDLDVPVLAQEFSDSLARCGEALSTVTATFPKCRRRSFRYLTNVSASNLSYVLKNCLPSFAIEPYAVIFSWLPVYGTPTGLPGGDRTCGRRSRRG